MKSVSSVLLFVVFSFCPQVFADTNSPPADANAIEVIADTNAVVAELVCVLDTNGVGAEEVLQFRNRVIDFLRKKLPRPNKITALGKNKIKMTLDLSSAIGPSPVCARLDAKNVNVKSLRRARSIRIDSSEDRQVYVTKTGKRYHRKTCSSLSKSSIKLKLSEAKAKGCTPCKRCKP